ncbi:leucine-rich repeat domain-containing protein [Vibrio navarrensis]|uniref:leucine-rich repeat domain-containing protein n=1 Tax=Vibrio navarrensis TaxID=29495 RepID=UPI00186AB7D8|nr:hypothetical protein [Vibrio navarrensis]MBE4620026.1 hypothetical protein [Vibrio navarrensis]
MLKKTLLAATVSVLSACGGDSGGSADTPATPQNRPPSVELGQDITTEPLQPIELLAQHSDPDGDVLTFQWQQIAGPALNLQGIDSEQLTFETPQVVVDTRYAFRLTVTDPKGQQATDTVAVTVKYQPDNSQNQAPVLYLEKPFAVQEETQEVRLQASATDSDGSIASIYWQQLSGPTVTLSDPSSFNPTFTVPNVDEDDLIQFDVKVTDNLGASAKSGQVITVHANNGNQRPVVSLGDNQTVQEGTPLTVTANASDSDGTITEYSWAQLSGPEANLSNKDSAEAQLTVPAYQPGAANKIRISVQVVDDQHGRSVSSVDLTIVPKDGSFSSIRYRDPEMQRCVEDLRDFHHWSAVTDVVTLECPIRYEISTTMDLAAFPNLRNMIIRSPKLSDFNANYTPDIEQLTLYLSALSHVDLKPLADLQSLRIERLAQLQSLDLSYSSALTDLDIRESKLPALDLTATTALEAVEIRSTELAALQLADMPSLQRLVLTQNQLSELNLTKMPALIALAVNGNQLTALDLSELTALTTFSASDNQLTALTFAEGLPLKMLILDKNPISTLNLRPFVELEQLRASDTKLKALDFSHNEKLTTLLVEKVPSLTQLTGDVTQLHSLDISYSGVTSVDFAALNNLQILGASGMSLQHFDASKHPKLKQLMLADNQLSTLDISANPDLLVLDVQGNQLKTLDLTHNPETFELTANDNQLENVILPEGSRLSYLSLANNQLKSVDVVKAINVFDVELNNNPLSSLDIGELLQLRALDVSNTPISDFELAVLSSGFWCLVAANHQFSTAMQDKVAEFAAQSGHLFSTLPRGDLNVANFCHQQSQ